MVELESSMVDVELTMWAVVSVCGGLGTSCKRQTQTNAKFNTIVDFIRENTGPKNKIKFQVP